MTTEVEERIISLVEPLDKRLKLVKNIDHYIVFHHKDLMWRLKTLRHHEDEHHNGETILRHIIDVFSNITRMHEHKAETLERIQKLKMVTLLHDLGKAYTCKYDEKRGKPTFNGHDETSFEIAGWVAHEHRWNPNFTKEVLDLVLYHDLLFRLWDNRQPGTTTYKYLKKFHELPVLSHPHIKDLLRFSVADNSKSKGIHDDYDHRRTILNDLEKYRSIQIKQKVHEQQLKERRERNLMKYRENIIVLIQEAGVPEAIGALPNMKAVNTYLGIAKQYKTIKQIKFILEEWT